MEKKLGRGRGGNNRAYWGKISGTTLLVFEKQKRKVSKNAATRRERGKKRVDGPAMEGEARVITKIRLRGVLTLKNGRASVGDVAGKGWKDMLADIHQKSEMFLITQEKNQSSEGKRSHGESPIKLRE